MAEMILRLKAAKIWLILIIGSEGWIEVVKGWYFLVFDLKAIKSFGETEDKFWQRLFGSI